MPPFVIPATPQMDDPFLASTIWIDHARPNIKRQAAALRRSDAIATTRSFRERTGWRYAKSHLLAALLRANGIPAALAYQRLSTWEAALADLPDTHVL